MRSVINRRATRIRHNKVSKFKIIKYSKQEIIPVGCVPTVAVAAARCQYQGGSLPREGICVGRGLPRGEGVYPTPLTCEQTDPSENITFPCDR